MSRKSSLDVERVRRLAEISKLNATEIAEELGVKAVSTITRFCVKNNIALLTSQSAHTGDKMALVGPLLRGDSISKAGREAGYPPNSKKLYEDANDDEVQSALALALENVGVTDELIAQTIQGGMRATRLVPVTSGKKKGDTETGELFREVPDHSVRLKGAEMAAKYKGHEPVKKVEGTVLLETHEDRAQRRKELGERAKTFDLTDYEVVEDG